MCDTKWGFNTNYGHRTLPFKWQSSNGFHFYEDADATAQTFNSLSTFNFFSHVSLMCMFQDVLKFGSFKLVYRRVLSRRRTSGHHTCQLFERSPGTWHIRCPFCKKNNLKTMLGSVPQAISIYLKCFASWRKETSIHFPHDLTRLKASKSQKYIHQLSSPRFLPLISHWSGVHCSVSTRNVPHACRCTILAQCRKDFLPMTTHYGERAQDKRWAMSGSLIKGRAEGILHILEITM